MKIILYVIIIIGSSLYGILKATAYSERNAELRRFIKSFEKFKIEIEYRQSTLPEICARIDYHFFMNICQVYQNNEEISFGDAWSKSARASYNNAMLAEEALNVIEGIGYELGGSGISGQSRLIELYITALNQIYDATEYERPAKCRLYTSMGMAAGITIVILMI